MNKLFGWSLILAVNVLLITAFSWVLLDRTDTYIEKQSKSTLIYDIHSLRRQVLVPNQKYQRGRVEFSINKMGFRGRVPTAKKLNGNLRLFVLGGSSAFDHHLAEGQSWPERLEGHLSVIGGGSVESYNFGIPGYSSRETLSNYIDKVRWLEPDLLVFYHGWNDLKYMRMFAKKVDVDRFYSVKNWRDQYKFITAERPFRNWYALQILSDQFWTKLTRPKAPQLKEGVSKAPSVDKAHVYQELGPSMGLEYYRKNIESFVQAAISDGVRPILAAQNTLVHAGLPKDLHRKVAFRWVQLSLPELVKYNDLMVEVLSETAKKYQVPFVDLRKQINGRPEFFVDHVHMSPKGSKFFANLLSQEIAKRVANVSLNKER